MSKLSLFTLALLISFASINGILFTAALPAMAAFFAITAADAQQTITGFLLGYALGQLFYGPLVSRFGGKPILYMGIFLQIISSLLCVIASRYHHYDWLIVARFFVALGAGVGLKMTFTIVNECYPPSVASQKIAYLMLAFAISPSLGVAFGGYLTDHYGWISCFYASAIYGVIILFLTILLPETHKVIDKQALNLRYLLTSYSHQFRDRRLVMGSLLMGCSTSFVYLFVAIAPFVAISLMRLTPTNYGLFSMVPAIGLVLATVANAYYAKRYPLIHLIKLGIGITIVGVISLLVAALLHLPVLFSLFLPMVLIYFGTCFVLANASTLALAKINDKAQGSAIMSFINMGFATLMVFIDHPAAPTLITLPEIFAAICIVMLNLVVFYPTESAKV